MRKADFYALMASAIGVILGILSNHLWFPPILDKWLWPLFILLCVLWIITLVIQQKFNQSSVILPLADALLCLAIEVISNHLWLPPIFGKWSLLLFLLLTASFLVLVIIQKRYEGTQHKLNTARLSPLIWILVFGVFMTAFVLGMKHNNSPAPPEPGSEKEFAQWYCHDLEKQVYPMIYTYMIDDRTVVGKITINGLPSFETLVHSKDKSSKVTNCSFQSEKMLSEDPGVAFDSPGDGRPISVPATINYKITLLITRDNHSYQATLIISVEGDIYTLLSVDRL